MELDFYSSMVNADHKDRYNQGKKKWAQAGEFFNTFHPEW